MEFGNRLDTTGLNCRRHVYELNQELCIKLIRPNIRRRIQDWRWAISRGIWDGMIANDIRINHKSPLPTTPHIHGVVTLPNGKRGLLQEVVRNGDGSVARTLHDYDIITDPLFWDQLYRDFRMLIAHQLYPCDIGTSNILVQESEAGLQPVLFDFKQVVDASPAQWRPSSSFLQKKALKAFRKQQYKWLPHMPADQNISRFEELYKNNVEPQHSAISAVFHPTN